MNQYLDILGLQPGVSEADIKKAYRKLAKLYHPDINKDPDAQNRFVEITEAYNFLMEVGATPHNEAVNYAYDTHVREYAERRKKAKEEARARQRQAAEEKRKTLFIIYNYTDYLVSIFLLCNFLLLTDYLLPSVAREERIIKLTRSYESDNQYGQNLIYRHSILHFENYAMLVDREVSDSWEKVSSIANIHATPLLGTVVKADVILNSQATELHPIFSVYNFFFFLIPVIILLGTLYFRWPKSSDNKIGLIAILFILFIIQILVFLSDK